MKRIQIAAALLSLGVITSSAYAAPRMNFGTFYYFAKRASAAYDGTKAIRGRHPGKSGQVVRVATPGGTHVKYFMERSVKRKRQTIVVRGTVDNVSKNLNFQAQGNYDEKAKVYLHAGYRKAARIIYADLKPSLKKGYTNFLTGHSLGGSVATILAMYLRRDGYSIGGVYTFGQPKVTNLAGAKAFQGLPVWRIVNQNDIATLGPPSMKGKGGVFAHLGREVILLSGKKYTYLSQKSARKNSLNAMAKYKTVSSATDHAIKFYLKNLRGKLKGAKAVPFGDRQNFVKRHRRSRGDQYAPVKRKSNLSSGN